MEWVRYTSQPSLRSMLLAEIFLMGAVVEALLAAVPAIAGLHAVQQQLCAITSEHRLRRYNKCRYWAEYSVSAPPHHPTKPLYDLVCVPGGMLRVARLHGLQRFFSA